MSGYEGMIGLVRTDDRSRTLIMLPTRLEGRMLVGDLRSGVRFCVSMFNIRGSCCATLSPNLRRGSCVGFVGFHVGDQNAKLDGNNSPVGIYEKLLS